MIPRRTLVKTLAGLPLAAVLADPLRAHAAAAATRLTNIVAADGRELAGALAIPERLPAPAVLLVHEWWGLNDEMKSMAVRLSENGYLALAVDLFNGRVATTADDARALVQGVDEAEALTTLTSWLLWLKNHPDGTRQVATVGWCFGGGWALRAAVAEAVDATVVYYGRVDLGADRLRRLKGPVLGHFARRDRFIDERMVDAFRKAMADANRPYEVYWYDADHAFANPTGGNYDKEDARLAWRRTLDFLEKTLARA
ncbi:MAG: dienelactone hydrolase family protein [Rhodospirillales bacterium]|nr:dienelactone hydrolase family protein [Rhodospirillales bacterium]